MKNDHSINKFAMMFGLVFFLYKSISLLLSKHGQKRVAMKVAS